VERLGAALGMSLENPRRESNVGAFAADVVVTHAGHDATVVIENQLEQSDHDHLGKSLTYAAGLKASYIVWIATKIRPEHRAALDWLNTISSVGVGFFGVEIEGLRIVAAVGSESAIYSPTAPNFRVVVAPNNWQKEQAALQAVATSERKAFFLEFYTQVFARLKASGIFPNLNQPKARHDVQVESVRTLIRYAYAFSREKLRVNFWIENPDGIANLQLYKALESRKAQIESSIGHPLTWVSSPDVRRQQFYLERDVEKDIEKTIEWAVKAMIDLKRTLEPMLNEILPSIKFQAPPSGDSDVASEIEENPDTTQT